MLHVVGELRVHYFLLRLHIHLLISSYFQFPPWILWLIWCFYAVCSFVLGYLENFVLADRYKEDKEKMVTMTADRIAACEDRFFCKEGNYFYFRNEFKEILKQNEPEITVSWERLATVMHHIAYKRNILNWATVGFKTELITLVACDVKTKRLFIIYS